MKTKTYKNNIDLVNDFFAVSNGDTVMFHVYENGEKN